MAVGRVTYRLSSWIHPRLEARPSPIAGRGLFAATPIRADEPVMIWGGEVVERWRKGCVAIAEDRYLADPEDGVTGLDDLINHSCDPNLWMQDEVTLIARRDIAAGEELTGDYAMWEADEGWASGWRCRCGRARCRGVVTGRDWRSAELQERYRHHFSPFVNRRIRRLLGEA